MENYWKGSVAIGIIEKEVLRLDKYMKASVAIGQIYEGKCCDWTNIGREVLRLDNLSEGKCLRLDIYIGNEVLRLDNYLRSVPIGANI